MKILIVGGASSLAVALVPILSVFADVITAGRSGCDVYLDLNDPLEKIFFPKDIDVVVNAVASAGGESIEDMIQAETVNVIGVLKLCQLCHQWGVKQFVLLSSIYVYLDSKSIFYNIYSLSKKHSDEVVQLYSAMFDLPVVILRPSQFYGVGEIYRKNQPFLYNIIDKVEKNEDVLLYGKNDALRNFIHVEDLSRIIALVIQLKIQGVYKCMSLENVSFSEIANAAINAFDSKSNVQFLKEQPDVPDNIFEIDDTLYSLIDYYPQISISAGMIKEAAHRKLIK